MTDEPHPESLSERFETACPPPLKLLEAGCGRHVQPFKFHEPCHVVGIDISAAALEANKSLDERIVGDLQTYPLPHDAFDIVICWDVLEHLREPQRALENLVRSLRPGGKLVIGLPDVLTPKALVTKFTPHRLHVFLYRRLFNFPDAGHPDHGPFPTFLRWSLRRRSIEDFALIQGLTIEEFTRQRSAPMAPIYERHPHATALLVSVWKLLSGGVDPRESELRVVLRKTNPGSEHA